MLPVVVRDNNVEKALKQMKRQGQKDGLYKEVRERVAFIKPSEKKQRKLANKRRRIIKSKKMRLMREGY
jgi:small subunit ribosomal protein S21